jgi:hypothetical protein
VQERLEYRESKVTTRSSQIEEVIYSEVSRIQGCLSGGGRSVSRGFIAFGSQSSSTTAVVCLISECAGNRLVVPQTGER